jgi:hypothetical protein
VTDIRIFRNTSYHIPTNADYESITVGYDGLYGEAHISVDGIKVSWKAENLPAVIEALTALNKEIESNG